MLRRIGHPCVYIVGCIVIFLFEYHYRKHDLWPSLAFVFWVVACTVGSFLRFNDTMKQRNNQP